MGIPTLRASSTLANRLSGYQYQLPAGKQLDELDLSASLLHSVPESVVRDNLVLPVSFDGETIIFATEDDSDVMLQDKLRFTLNRNVRFVTRSEDEIRRAIAHFYGSPDDYDDFLLCPVEDAELTAVHSQTRSSGLHRRGKKIGGVSEFKRGVTKPSVNTSAVNKSNGRDGWMFRTIADGQRVLAYHYDGSIEVLQGPARVWKGLTRFQPMQHFVAHPKQYLNVRFRDGHEKTTMGPTELWQDPRIHESITVNDCLDLAAKEAVVVYGPSLDSQSNQTSTTRRIVNGPGLFAPNPGEWLHQFSWHASHGGSRGEEKRPNALQFHKLWLMPDQMYHDVRDVRTADDAVLTIRLMIFFELVDIERMLDTTHDPIGDFINAATSDVIEFTGKRSFDEFKQQTEQLNELDTYQQLLHRANQCGYKINNVVYRGYGAPDSLQAMHDEAIQSRTRLQLEKATEQQAQELEDYKLKCQMDRAERRRQEQMTEIDHDLEMKRRQGEAELQQQRLNAEFQRDQKRAEEQLTIEMRRQSDEQKQQHLEALRSMKVDLTDYLTQGRADQIIEVRGESKAAPQLHLDNGARKRAPR